jgi:hypothetical protein
MIDEVSYVEKCPIDGCEMRFVGATPDDVREHMTDEHDPLGKVVVFSEESHV